MTIHNHLPISSGQLFAEICARYVSLQFISNYIHKLVVLAGSEKEYQKRRISFNEIAIWEK